MKSYLIKIEIYHHDLIIVNGQDDEVKKYLKKNFNVADSVLEDSIHEDFDGSTFFPYSQIGICWIRDLITGFNTTLLHELEHAANQILRNVGIEHTDETEESYAYLKSYIQTKFMDELKKEKKKKTSVKRKPKEIVVKKSR
jgi:hypothetical protein